MIAQDSWIHLRRRDRQTNKDAYLRLMRDYWQVESRHGDRRAGAVNGPLSFTLDSNVPTSLQGVVVRAPLAGTAEPQEGRLLVATDVAPAAGRDGAAGGAVVHPREAPPNSHEFGYTQLQSRLARQADRSALQRRRLVRGRGSPMRRGTSSRNQSTRPPSPG